MHPWRRLDVLPCVMSPIVYPPKSTRNNPRGSGTLRPSDSPGSPYTQGNSRVPEIILKLQIYLNFQGGRRFKSCHPDSRWPREHWEVARCGAVFPVPITRIRGALTW